MRICPQIFVLAILCSSLHAQAQVPDPVAEAEYLQRPPPPYSLPFALRPAVPVTVARLDSSMALFKDVDGNLGVTTVVIPTGGYRFHPSFMGMVRLGIIGNAPPTGEGSASFTNAILGGFYSLKLPASLRLNFFLGGTLPIGTGADKANDPAAFSANSAGPLARSAMDNALFALNDVALIPGLDLTYIDHGFTLQAEVTFFELMRVRNEALQPDRFKTNMTTGLHVGYFFTGAFSFAAELRYQRWLAPPAAVSMDPTGLLRDNLSLALGPRFHVKAGVGWFRPSVNYSVGLLGMLAERSYHTLGIDLPFVFF